MSPVSSLRARDDPQASNRASPAASIVALVIVSAYKGVLLNSTDPRTPVPGPGAVTSIEWVDVMWRLLIGLGCVPGAVALYFRLTIPETPRFTMDIACDVQQAARDVGDFLNTGAYYVDPDVAIERVSAPKASRSDFAAYLAQKGNWRLLLGTAYSWFALDFAFYGLGLNQSAVLENIQFGTSDTADLSPGAVYKNLQGIAVGNIILSVAGLIPGFWVTFFLIDRWGRKPIQFMGFSVLTVLFVIMGAFPVSPSLHIPGPLPAFFGV